MINNPNIDHYVHQQEKKPRIYLKKMLKPAVIALLGLSTIGYLYSRDGKSTELRESIQAKEEAKEEDLIEME